MRVRGPKHSEGKQLPQNPERDTPVEEAPSARDMSLAWHIMEPIGAL